VPASPAWGSPIDSGDGVLEIVAVWLGAGDGDALARVGVDDGSGVGVGWLHAMRMNARTSDDLVTSPDLSFGR